MYYGEQFITFQSLHVNDVFVRKPGLLADSVTDAAHKSLHLKFKITIKSHAHGHNRTRNAPKRTWIITRSIIRNKQSWHSYPMTELEWLSVTHSPCQARKSLLNVYKITADSLQCYCSSSWNMLENQVHMNSELQIHIQSNQKFERKIFLAVTLSYCIVNF